MEIIGVDNGYGYTKTVSTEFVTSLTPYGTVKPSMKDKVVFYEGQYYIVGGDRKKVITDKTTDEDTFILTLAGIGEELKRRNLTSADIILSVGLPLDRCSGQTRVDFKEYFQKHKSVNFEYEDIMYHVNIKDVMVSAQCVAGIIDLLSQNTIACPSIVVDIGSWTMDVLPIMKGENGMPKPQPAKVLSINNGVIKCMVNCNKEIRRVTGQDVDESQIQEVMRGNFDALPPKYSAIVQKVTAEYVKSIKDTLIENGFNIETMPVIFMGGGAIVTLQYGGEDLFYGSKYITNLRANAIGYERIAKQQFKNNQ